MSQLARLPEAPVAPEAPTPSEAEEREVARAQARLILIPFAFPMWLRMRRDRPELASRLAWAGWFNVAQSLMCVAVVGLTIWAVIAIPPLIAYYMSLVMD